MLLVLGPVRCFEPSSVGLSSWPAHLIPPNPQHKKHTDALADSKSTTAAAAGTAPWGGGLDLWGLLFTHSFAALVEDLLQVRPLLFLGRFDETGNEC